MEYKGGTLSLFLVTRCSDGLITNRGLAPRIKLSGKNVGPLDKWECNAKRETLLAVLDYPCSSYLQCSEDCVVVTIK